MGSIKFISGFLTAFLLAWLLVLSMPEVSATTQVNFITNQTATTLNITDTISSYYAQNYNQTWLEFDGVNDNLTIANQDHLSPNKTQAYTLSVWIKITDFNFAGVGSTTGYKTIIGKAKSGAYEFALQVSNSTGTNKNVTTITFYNATNAGLLCTKSSGVSLSPNQWHLITATYNGTGCSIWNEGLVKSSSSNNAGNYLTNTSSPIIIGTRLGSAGEAYLGLMDKIQIWNITQDTKQIRRLYNESDYGSGLGKSIPVLSYHQIGKDAGSASTIVNQSDFNAQMAWLNASGYHTITHDQWLQWKNNNYALPSKPIIIMFDDAWMSVYTNATPVMDSYGFIGETFVITNLSGMNSDYANYSHLSILLNKGWMIGSHSFNATSVINFTSSELLTAFNWTRYYIQSKIGTLPTMFVYPNNVYNSTIDKECTKYYTMCSGQSGSTNTQESFLFKNANLTYTDGLPIGMRRILIANDTTLTEFINAIDYHQGLVVSYNFNENNHTRAYDNSGLENNADIFGATWNNDGVLVTLTEGVDYLFSTTTKIFIASNVLYSYVMFLYETASSTDTDNNETLTTCQEIREGYQSFFPALIIIFTILGVIMIVSFILMLLAFADNEKAPRIKINYMAVFLFIFFIFIATIAMLLTLSSLCNL